MSTAERASARVSSDEIVQIKEGFSPLYLAGVYTDCKTAVTGQNYDTCYTIERALKTRFDRLGKVYPGSSFDNECESQFFNLRFFKKGTLHIEFKEEMLWQEFNFRACAGKQWLLEPEMKAYQERKRSPFEPAPVAPEPQAEVAPKLLALEAPTLTFTPTTPAEEQPSEQQPTIRRLAGPGKQLSWLDAAA